MTEIGNYGTGPCGAWIGVDRKGLFLANQPLLDPLTPDWTVPAGTYDVTEAVKKNLVTDDKHLSGRIGLAIDAGDYPQFDQDFVCETAYSGFELEVTYSGGTDMSRWPTRISTARISGAALALVVAVAMGTVWTQNAIHADEVEGGGAGGIAVWMDAPLHMSVVAAGPVDLMAHWSSPAPVASVVFTVDGTVAHSTGAMEPYGTTTAHHVELSDGEHLVRVEVSSSNGAGAVAEATVFAGDPSTQMDTVGDDEPTVEDTTTSSTDADEPTTTSSLADGNTPEPTPPTSGRSTEPPSMTSMSAERNVIDNMTGCGAERSAITIGAHGTTSVTLRWTLGARSGEIATSRTADATWTATVDGPTIAGPDHSTGQATLTATATGPGGSVSRSIPITVTNCKP